MCRSRTYDALFDIFHIKNNNISPLRKLQVSALIQIGQNRYNAFKGYLFITIFFSLSCISDLSNYCRHEFNKSLPHDVSAQAAPLMSNIMIDASKATRDIVKLLNGENTKQNGLDILLWLLYIIDENIKLKEITE